VTIARTPGEPKGWRAAARRLVARLRPGGGAAVGSIQAADFDVAARQAYRAALKLDDGMPLAPAPPRVRPAGPPGLGTEGEPLDGRDESAAAVAADMPPEPPAAAFGESPERATDAPRRGRPTHTSPDSMLRTPSGVDSIADDFFDSLIRRVEDDR
jgi:hypothetical protein